MLFLIIDAVFPSSMEQSCSDKARCTVSVAPNPMRQHGPERCDRWKAHAKRRFRIVADAREPGYFVGVVTNFRKELQWRAPFMLLLKTGTVVSRLLGRPGLWMVVKPPTLARCLSCSRWVSGTSDHALCPLVRCSLHSPTTPLARGRRTSICGSSLVPLIGKRVLSSTDACPSRLPRRAGSSVSRRSFAANLRPPAGPPRFATDQAWLPRTAPALRARTVSIMDGPGTLQEGQGDAPEPPPPRRHRGDTSSTLGAAPALPDIPMQAPTRSTVADMRTGSAQAQADGSLFVHLQREYCIAKPHPALLPHLSNCGNWGHPVLHSCWDCFGVLLPALPAPCRACAACICDAMSSMLCLYHAHLARMLLNFVWLNPYQPRAAMVNGADTAETDSDTEAAQEVAQEALGLGGENFAAGAGSAALQVRACTVDRGRLIRFGSCFQYHFVIAAWAV